MRAFVFAAIGSLFSALAGAQTTTLETQNEQVVRRYVEAINRHDAKAAAAGFAEDVKNFGR